MQKEDKKKKKDGKPFNASITVSADGEVKIVSQEF